MTLVPIDPKNEASVLGLLEHAAQWLAEAVHRGEPGEIAMVKAQMATAAEATKQLNLSKEIQLDAQEMVRRAEYALGRAIRRGQAEGTIAKRGDIGSAGAPGINGGVPGSTRNGHLATAKTITGARHASEIEPLYDLAVAQPEEFDAAVNTAKAEGNLSRANVVRKIKGQNEGTPLTRQQRADLIADLAAQGVSSRQMPARVGVTEETVRQIARDFDIEIPADRIVGRTKRLDHTQMVESSVTDIENATEFIESFIDLAEVDFTGADEWVSSLSNSIAALTRFRKQIKEKTHV
jgi:hypothetical protein